MPQGNREAVPPENNPEKLNALRNAVVIALILIFTIVPLCFMLFGSVYTWHIKQPEFWQGGLVLLGFMLLTFALCCLKKRWAVVFVGVFGLLYLTTNGVIIPFIVVYLYMECLCLIGYAVLPFGKGAYSKTQNFIGGVSVWGAFAIVVSLIGRGGFSYLRALTILLAMAALLVTAGRGRRYTPLAVEWGRGLQNIGCSKWSLFAFVFTAFVVLALMAKSNIAIDYDSWWYGIRPEYVLIGSNSFYDDLGFTGFVYYYPKLMELLFVPISNLGDNSFIIIANIFVLVFLLMAMVAVCKQLWGWKLERTIILLAVLVTVPALANIAATAKPDILGAFFVFCAWAFFAIYLKKHKLQSLMYSLLCMVLCTGTKLTYILWGGLLFLCMVATLVLSWRKPENRIHKAEWCGTLPVGIVSAFGVFFTLGVHYRTLKLTGLPLYPLLASFFTKIGFKAKYPFMSSNTIGFSDSDGIVLEKVFYKIYQFVMNPTGLEKLIVLWTSNVLLCAFAVWLVYKGKKKRGKGPSRFFIVLVSVVFAAALLYYVISTAYGDGNYYILPIVVLLFCIIDSFMQRSRENQKLVPKQVLAVLCVSLVATQFPLTFLTHPSWAIGTRAFSGEIFPNNFETQQTNRMALEKYGYAQIDEYIAGNMPKERVIISTPNTMIYGRMRGTVESAEGLLPYFLTDLPYSSFEEFERNIQYTNTAAFIFEKGDDVEGYFFLKYGMQYLEKYGYQYILVDESAVLYVLNPY